MTIKRFKEYPRPTFTTVEESQQWASDLVESLQQEGYERVQDFDILGLTNVGWIDVREYGTEVNAQQDGFSNAITDIGSTETALLITNQQDVTDDATVPSTMTLRFKQGGSLNISSGKTVTINGHVEAGLYQIFEGSGTANFGTGSVKEVYPQWFGAIGDNSTDNQSSFTKGLKASLNVKRFRVPGGIYIFKSCLDLADIFDASAHGGFSFICDPKAEFKAFDNTVTPIINIATALGGQFICCTFYFGIINGNLKTVNGIQISYVNDSIIRINQVANCTSNSGVLIIIPDGATIGCFNNLFFIGRASFGGHGLALRSPSSGNHGIQANQFHVGQLNNNTGNGVFVGTDSAKDVSDRNIFYLGAVEINGAYGIRDYTGSNMYFIASSNSNTSGGFRLESGADFTEVQGCIQDATPIADFSEGKLRVNGIHDFIAFTDADTTPSVGVPGVNYMFYPSNFKCANTGATTITAFDNGRLGQIINVKIDANTTIQDGTPIRLAEDINFSGDANNIIVLECIAADTWLEVSRNDPAMLGISESTTVSAPLVLTTYDISVPVATSSANGYLSSTNWSTFNSKAGSGANSDITSMSGITGTIATPTGITMSDGGTVGNATAFINFDDTNHWLEITGNVGIGATNLSEKLAVAGNFVLPKTSGNGIKIDNATPTFGWRDLQGDILVKTVGANDPDYNDYASTGIHRYQFKNTAVTEVFNDFHISHDYVPGTEVYVHIHWSQTVIDTGGAASAPGVAKWYFDANYSKGHDRGAFPASVTTVSVPQAASGTIRKHLIAEVQLSTSGQVGGQDLEPDGILTIRTYRDSDDEADTLNQRPWVHHVDIHYQSTNIATKQKAFPFYT